jgi:hypothetical protein
MYGILFGLIGFVGVRRKISRHQLKVEIMRLAIDQAVFVLPVACLYLSDGLSASAISEVLDIITIDGVHHNPRSESHCLSNLCAVQLEIHFLRLPINECTNRSDISKD